MASLKMRLSSQGREGWERAYLNAHRPFYLQQLPKQGRQQGGLPSPHWTHNSQQTALGHGEVNPDNPGEMQP